MALDERPSATEPAEERLRRRIRAVAACTFLFLVVVLAFADTFKVGHASEFVFGSIIGGFLLLVGVEAGSRFLGK